MEKVLPEFFHFNATGGANVTLPLKGEVKMFLQLCKQFCGSTMG